MVKYRGIQIPKSLAEEVDEEIEKTSFSSRAELVKHLLRNWLDSEKSIQKEGVRV